MAPKAAIFVDKNDPESAMYNNFRLYGSCLLVVMGMYTYTLIIIIIQHPF